VHRSIPRITLRKLLPDGLGFAKVSRLHQLKGMLGAVGLGMGKEARQKKTEEAEHAHTSRDGNRRAMNLLHRMDREAAPGHDAKPTSSAAAMARNRYLPLQPRRKTEREI
jgi:hypothetical protein